MATGGSGEAATPNRRVWFTTTHWSVVLAAREAPSPQASAALEQLCRTYWYPLYAYVRRKGHAPQDAEDLTQEFFARLLDRNAFAEIRRDGGKFRSFLLTALNHFLVNEWEYQRAGKRDERRVAFSLDEVDAESRFRSESADEGSPECVFDREWAATVLEQAMNRLRDEQTAAGKADFFLRLRPCLTGSEPMLPYANLAGLLGLTECAVKMAVHRLRRRYGELLRAEIVKTVSRPEEMEEEIRHLIAVTAR